MTADQFTVINAPLLRLGDWIVNDTKDPSKQSSSIHLVTVEQLQLARALLSDQNSEWRLCEMGKRSMRAHRIAGLRKLKNRNRNCDQ